MNFFGRIGPEENPELLKTISDWKNIDFRDDEGTTYLHVSTLNHKL